MSSASRKALDLNSQAVALLQKDCQDGAEKLLRASLKFILRAVRGAVVGNSSKPCQDGWSDNDESTHLYAYTVCLHEIYESGESVEDVFDVFNRAFVFLDDSIGQQPLNDERSRLDFASMVLFNMGLCHHQRGIKLKDTESLECALRFYELAFCTASKGLEGSTSRFVLLAAANNMGHIKAKFCQYEEVQQYTVLLQELVALATYDEEFALNEEDYLFFFIAMNFLAGRNTAPAA